MQWFQLFEQSSRTGFIQLPESRQRILIDLGTIFELSGCEQLGGPLDVFVHGPHQLPLLPGELGFLSCDSSTQTESQSHADQQQQTNPLHPFPLPSGYLQTIRRSLL
jgi:hypothetical protein